MPRRKFSTALLVVVATMPAACAKLAGLDDLPPLADSSIDGSRDDGGAADGSDGAVDSSADARSDALVAADGAPDGAGDAGADAQAETDATNDGATQPDGAADAGGGTDAAPDAAGPTEGGVDATFTMDAAADASGPMDAAPDAAAPFDAAEDSMSVVDGGTDATLGTDAATDASAKTDSGAGDAMTIDAGCAGRLQASGACVTTIVDTTGKIGDCSYNANPYYLCTMGIGPKGVYWGDTSGDLMSVAFDGGGVSRLLVLPGIYPLPVSILGTSDSVYVLADQNFAARDVYQVPLGGSALSTLAVGDNYTRMAIANGQVFYSVSSEPGGRCTDAGCFAPPATDAGAIISIPEDGGAAVLVVNGLRTGDYEPAYGLAANSTNLFWEDQSGLYTAPLGGGTIVTLADPPSYSNPDWIAEGATANAVIMASTTYPVIFSVPPDGLTFPSVLVADAGGTAGFDHQPIFANDEKWLYWASNSTMDAGGTARVMKAPLDGGATQTLASGFGVIPALAIDDSSVYVLSETPEAGIIFSISPR